jgi:multicomponent Na+:H+ antiporter subunit B
MKNIILEKIARLFLQVMAVFAILLLLRGHNKPGGGFIAGIIIATGFIMYGMVFGSAAIERILHFNTRKWMGVGLLLVLLAAVIPVFMGLPPLTGMWYVDKLPLLGELHLGTPLLFDTGIFIGVIGVILSIVITIMDVLKWNS